MRIKTMLNVSVLLLVFSAAMTAQEEHKHGGTPPEKLGSVQFENSCKPEVQADFTRAIALLHSFWYDEANRQFRLVAERDPACSMAWWGVAMTNWHPLWEPRGPNPDAMKAGQEALAKAKSAGARSERESGYIAALDKFYGNVTETPHLDRVLAYEKAMSDLHARFPKDDETTIFYALSLVGSAIAGPPDKTYARQLKAGAMLEPIISRQPEHPGVTHFIIHAYDYPALAPKALAAARGYAKIAPDAPHALHMPSHIFTRLGLWQESIDSNLASAAAARKHGMEGDELHALDYLEFAYLQTGQDKLAQDVVRNRVKVRDDDGHRFAGVFATVSIPARYVIERRQWADAASLPVNNLPGGRYSWADATVYFARALGAARSGKLEQARADLAKLAALKQTLVEAQENYWTTQVELQRLGADAWLQYASGKKDAGLRQMRSAVELEDTTDKHPVTPGSIVPMRVLLGDMLLESKQPGEALDVFTALLKTEPGRFAGLYGAARAAAMKGDSKLAAEFYGKLSKLGSNGNMEREELKQARQYLATRASQ